MINSHQKILSKVFFPNLDGLRSIAFLMVYLYHTVYFSFKLLPIRGTFIESVINTISYGATGVSIFFVLSGFLITYLLLTEKEREGKINIRFFYFRRILRIWPLYYVVIIFAVSIFPYFKIHFGQPADFTLSPVYYYSFLSNFEAINSIKTFSIKPLMMFGISWSVSIEEQFYLLWPLLFTIFPQKLYKYIFISIIVLCLLFRILNRADEVVLYFHTFSVCSDLSLGGLIAYYSINSPKFLSFFGDLHKKSIVCIYASGVLWLFLGHQHITSKDFAPFNRLISISFFAFIILEQNYSKNSFYKFSNSKMLSFWGKYTYGLYMLHPIGIWMTTFAISKLLSIGNPDNVFLPAITRDFAAFFITLLLSYLSYEFFEKRFLKLKDKFSLINSKNLPAIQTIVKE